MSLILFLLSVVCTMMLLGSAQETVATGAGVGAGADADEIVIPLTVNDQTYDFVLRDTDESTIIELAKQFCTELIEELLLTADTMNEKCVVPVASELYRKSHSTLVVPLTINGQSYDFSLVDTEESTIIRMSEEFCAQTAESLGLMTAETVRADCVEPVANELYQRTRHDANANAYANANTDIGDDNAQQPAQP